MAGRGIERAHYEMVAHKKLGVQLGDQIPLGLHTYTVVGLTQGAIDHRTANRWSSSRCPMPRRWLFQRDNEEVRNQRARLARTLAARKPLSPQAAANFCRRPWLRTPTSSTPSWSN